MLATIGLFLVQTILTFTEACNNDPGGVYNIDFVKFDLRLSFHLRDRSNLSSYFLTAIYTWDLSVPNGSTYDGILYKMIDRHGDLPDVHGFSPVEDVILDDTDYAKNVCSGLNNTLWTKDASGNSLQCRLPCTKYFPSDCTYNEICSLLEEGYKALPWKQRRLELPIKFGRIYDFVLLVYRNWYAGKSHNFNGDRVVKYCREEFIRHYNISHEDADEFCEDNQQLADSSLSSGPPSMMEKYYAGVNLTINRAIISFRFKEPHDISPNVYFIGFKIYVSFGEYPHFLRAHPRDDRRDRSDKYYSVTVTKVEFERMNWIIVTPYVKRLEENNCSPYCRTFGLALKRYFFPLDVDACVTEEMHERYCDVEANCTDLTRKIDIPASCSCPAGFLGNGINTTWPEGTGCYEPGPCSGLNSTCTPPSTSPCQGNITCSCGTPQPGSTERNRTEGSNANLVIGLAVAIPVIVIIFLAALLLTWRLKNTKNGGVRLHEENL